VFKLHEAADVKGVRNMSFPAQGNHSKSAERWINSSFIYVLQTVF